MSAPRDAGAETLVLTSVHTAAQQVGNALLAVRACDSRRACEHLISAQRELACIEKSLTWPGGTE